MPISRKIIFNRLERLRVEDTKNGKLLLLSLFIGILSGLLSSVFRFFLTSIENFHEYWIQLGQESGLWSILGLILATSTSIFIAFWLVRKYAPEAGGSGIQEIEGALDGVRPLRWKRVIPVKFFGSLFSLGSGLLLGREGPTVQLGASVGKMVKDVSKHPDYGNNPLISAGAAAGLAGAFNAPLSGIIFVIEEMNGHFKFNFYNLASIMIGAGISDVVVRIILGSEVSLPLGITSEWEMTYLWLFPVLGVFIGAIGWVYNQVILFSLDAFKKYQNHIVLTSLFLGVLVVSVTIFSPYLSGAGYNTIHQLVQNNYSLTFLLLLLTGRFILSIVSYGSGLPGGLFTPMLTLGIIMGLIFGVLAEIVLPGSVSEKGIFAIAGMAALFSSTVRAPLTGLVLAVEMTSNYGLILPLILCTAAASVMTTMLGNRPIYSVLLERVLNPDLSQEDS